jgi:hypothetical protein
VPGVLLRVLTAALAALTLARAAFAADAVSAGPDTVRVTFYRGEGLPFAVRRLTGGSGLALVTETRTVDLPAGSARLELKGVADTLAPQSVRLTGLPGPVAESDFDYDLLSPGALVAKSVGQPVRLVRTDPKSGRMQDRPAVIRSGPDGVVLQTADGVEALRCSGLPERLVFDRPPPGLADRPTLSVRTASPAAGRYRLELSYLAAGFDWSADYVAELSPDGERLHLSGWLTLRNGSGTGFADAPTAVVAGELARTGDDQPVETLARAVEPACWPSEPWWKLLEMNDVVVVTGSRLRRMAVAEAIVPPQLVPPAPAPAPPPPPPPMAKETDLGDYKLYTLPEPTTVAARQTKQVRFLDQPSVRFERLFVVRAPPRQTSPAGIDGAERVLRLRNTEAMGLGQPLPSGRVVVMAPGPDGSPGLLGRDRLKDTPADLPLELSLGRSSEVLFRGSSTLLPRRGSSDAPHWSVALQLTNAGDRPAVVEVREPGADRIDLTAEDGAHLLDGGVLKWRLKVAAHGTARFRYAYAER